VKDMPTNLDLKREKAAKQKKVVGAIAVALLILFTVLAFLTLIDGLVWIIAAVVVAGVANLLFRRIGREPL
jgi:hypothetical protein